MTTATRLPKFDEIVVDVDDHVATVALHRPQRRNAATLGMLRELREAFAALEHDPEVRAVVLTGTGTDFCVGLDAAALTAVATLPADEQPDLSAPTRAQAPEGGFAAEFVADFGYLLTFPKPIIAAVNGSAAGLGVVLACYADLRFAASDARFAVAFAQRGLAAEYGLSWILPRLIGPANAFRMLWERSPFSAGQAQSFGLVSFLESSDVLVEAAVGYARRLVTESSPHSLMVIKEQVYRDLSDAFAPSYQRTLQAMGRCLAHEDFVEGVRSFVEKRPPRFAGTAKPQP